MATKSVTPHCNVCASRKFQSDHWPKVGKRIVCAEVMALELHKQNMVNGIGKMCGYCLFAGRPMAEAMTHFENDTRYRGSTCVCPRKMDQQSAEDAEKERRRCVMVLYKTRLVAYEADQKEAVLEKQRADWIKKGFACAPVPLYKFSDNDFPALGAPEVKKGAKGAKGAKEMAKEQEEKEQEEKEQEEKEQEEKEKKKVDAEKRVRLEEPNLPVFKSADYGQFTMRAYQEYRWEKQAKAAASRRYDDDLDF